MYTDCTKRIQLAPSPDLPQLDIFCTRACPALNKSLSLSLSVDFICMIEAGIPSFISKHLLDDVPPPFKDGLDEIMRIHGSFLKWNAQG